MTTAVKAEVQRLHQMLDNYHPDITNYFGHQMIKIGFLEEPYKGAQMQKEIVPEVLKGRIELLTAQADFGWTPAHIAAINGNTVGLKFLQTLNAISCKKDAQGKFPVDYARLCHPQLTHFFIPRRLRQEDLAPFLENVRPFFASKKVGLSTSPFSYGKDTHDFGIEIKELLFADKKGSHSFKNMQTIADTQGFKLRPSKIPYPLRDSLVKTQCWVAAILHSESTPIAVERCVSRALYLNHHGMFLSHHQFFKATLGATHMVIGCAMQELAETLGITDGRATPFYMEGGNHYLLTNTQGKQKLLIGEDLFITALNQLRKDQAFTDPFYPVNAIEEHRQALSADPKLLRETLTEMYAQGLLKEAPGREKGLLSQENLSNVFTRELGKKFCKKTTTHLQDALEQNYLTPLCLTEKDLKDGLPLAAKYLAQKQYTQQRLADFFLVNPEDILIIPQAAYHLDLFLRPGPKGSVFIQDYAFSLDLLKTIEQRADQLQLGPQEKHILRCYQETAEKLNQDLSPLLNETKNILAQGGFTPVPAPGMFYDTSPHLLNPHKIPTRIATYDLNFLNAVTGWSPQTHKYYYITTGAQIWVENRLGEVLMQSFKSFIQTYQPDTEVYFIGFDPEDPNDFSGAMSFREIEIQSGIHCHSLELETASHTD